MANNQYAVPTVSHTRCANGAIVITPNDSNDLNPYALFGLLATVAGVVKVDVVGSGTAVVIPIAAGILLPVQVRRVYSTGTTATGIVGLFKT